MSIENPKKLWKDIIKRLSSKSPLFQINNFWEKVEISLINDKLQIQTTRKQINLLRNQFLIQLNETVSELLNKKYQIEFIEIEIEKELIRKQENFLIRNNPNDFYSCPQNITISKSIKKFIDDHDPKTNVYCLWGNYGIGKTHLIGALINLYYLKLNFIYIDTSDFINKYYEYCKLEKPFDEFTNWILEHDLIIFDSFELSGKKPNINKAFVDLLERLEQNNKVIFIYNVKKHLFENISDSLTSKFSLITKLNDPDTEDIKTIVWQFLNSQNKNIKFSTESINYLVETLGNNIQVVISKLINILVLFGNPNTLTIIDLNTLQKTYKKISLTKKNKELINFTNNQQIKSLCQKLNFDVNEILTNTRKKEVVLKRNIVIYLLKTKLNLTHEDIGKIFNKNHSTVTHSIKMIAKKLEDKSFKKYIENFL